MQQVRLITTVYLFTNFKSFRSDSGIFFTFPSQYLCTIDQLYVFEVNYKMVLVLSCNLYHGLHYFNIYFKNYHTKRLCTSRRNDFIHSKYNSKWNNIFDSSSLATTIEITFVLYSRITKMVQFILFFSSYSK